jgi:opacity protein-like surface antigen
MKLLFQSGRASLLSIKFLALLFSIALGPSMVLAGGMPPDVEKEAMMEQSAEAEELSSEVKEPSTEVKKETVAEQSPDSGEPSTEVVEEMPEVKEDLPATTSGFTVGVRGALSILNSANISAPSVSFMGSQYGPLEATADFTSVSFMGSQYGPLEATADFTEGYSFNFALGYALGNGLRVEAEGGYIENCFEEMNVEMLGTLELTNTPTGKTKIAGEFSALTLMLNAYYDVDLGSNLMPYLGGGLGIARLSSGRKLGEGAASGRILVDDDDYVFAYQVGAGLGYRISNGLIGGNGLTVSLDYRYLASLEDPKFKGALTGNFVESEFGGHYIGGGIRLGLW